MMKYICKTRKSHYWNEDRFIVGKNFFMVLDGATPLIKSNSFNEACWMVNYLKRNIKKEKGSIRDRLLKLSKEGFLKLPSSIKEEDYLPSCSLCYVEYDEQYFYISILGDCEVIVKMKNGEIIRCATYELKVLDDLAIQEMKKISKEKNIHIIEARKDINDTLIRHRKMINKQGGYTAYTLSNQPEIREMNFHFKKDEVKELYLYSDGFAESFDTLGIYKNYQEMFSQSLDLEKEIEKIVRVSYQDKYCDKYPRFKVIDDITVIKVINE